ncbi:ribosomal protein S5, C-terminal domain-containing protein [Pavlovales sp. CCMP2436]|nr:ribosomal protein S5, C-terminal domain-containing protein [Pavlovales sp. CCMP2436]
MLMLRGCTSAALGAVRALAAAPPPRGGLTASGAQPLLGAPSLCCALRGGTGVHGARTMHSGAGDRAPPRSSTRVSSRGETPGALAARAERIRAMAKAARTRLTNDSLVGIAGAAEKLSLAEAMADAADDAADLSARVSRLVAEESGSLAPPPKSSAAEPGSSPDEAWQAWSEPAKSRVASGEPGTLRPRSALRAMLEVEAIEPDSLRTDAEALNAVRLALTSPGRPEGDYDSPGLLPDYGPLDVDVQLPGSEASARVARVMARKRKRPVVSDEESLRGEYDDFEQEPRRALLLAEAAAAQAVQAAAAAGAGEGSLWDGGEGSGESGSFPGGGEEAGSPVVLSVAAALRRLGELPAAAAVLAAASQGAGGEPAFAARSGQTPAAVHARLAALLQRSELEQPLGPPGPMDLGPGAKAALVLATAEAVARRAPPQFMPTFEALAPGVARTSLQGQINDTLSGAAVTGAEGDGTPAAAASFFQEVLHVRRVTKVTASQKHMSFSALVVVGNGKGAGGYGLGSASTQQAAVDKGTRAALKAVVYVPRYDSRTIFHELDGKFGATKLKLGFRARGKGLRAGERLETALELLGISDVWCKVHGSRNPINTIRALFDALSKQKTAAEEARTRGKRVIDVAREWFSQ